MTFLAFEQKTFPLGAKYILVPVVRMQPQVVILDLWTWFVRAPVGAIEKRCALFAFYFRFFCFFVFRFPFSFFAFAVVCICCVFDQSSAPWIPLQLKWLTFWTKIKG